MMIQVIDAQAWKAKGETPPQKQTNKRFQAKKMMQYRQK